jgi:hypothetical protein
VLYSKTGGRDYVLLGGNMMPTVVTHPFGNSYKERNNTLTVVYNSSFYS